MAKSSRHSGDDDADLNNNLLTSGDALSSTVTTYGYDSSDRLTQEPVAGHTTTFAYDGAGTVTRAACSAVVSGPMLALLGGLEAELVGAGGFDHGLFEHQVGENHLVVRVVGEAADPLVDEAAVGD